MSVRRDSPPSRQLVGEKGTDDVNHKELHVLLHREQDTHVSACVT